MTFPSTSRGLRLDYQQTLIALCAAPSITYVAGRLILGLIRSQTRPTDGIFRSPPKALESLIDTDEDSIPYPPDALEGSRDVDSPYGSIRVYEWGPKDGRKVLFVHGISTPCIAFAHMAKKLVDEDGCRVMLFDLFGRGYSDTPDPVIWKQDIKLFTSQMLLALTSSPLSWTGEGNGFTLVGYSLGGGVATTFASYFPNFVRSLVLIAPGGLMRASRIHWSSKLIYGGLLPDTLRDFLVRRRIIGPSPPPKTTVSPKLANGVPAVPVTEPELAAEHPAMTPNSTAPLFPHRSASAAESVVWQVTSHQGFLPAFISSIQHGPIGNEHARWRLIGSRLTAQRESADAAAAKQGLKEGKVLIIFGKTDGVVVPEETAGDAVEVLGKENVRIEMLEGGHDLPITNAHGCVEAIRDFWNGK